MAIDKKTHQNKAQEKPVVIFKPGSWHAGEHAMYCCVGVPTVRF